MGIGEESVKRLLSIDNFFGEEDFAPGFGEHPNHNGVLVEEVEDKNERHKDEEGTRGEEEKEER